MRRLFLGLTAGAAFGVMVLLVAVFVWPDEGRQESLNLGPADMLPVGEPRLFVLDPAEVRWALPPTMNGLGNLHDFMLAVIRHEDGSVSALLARDPRNACVLSWRTDLESFGPGGFFRDPCHGSTYDQRGLWVFGPSPRGMDYMDVDINERGEVVVDLRTLHRGTHVRQ